MPDAYELILIRHGESEGNVARERAQAARSEVIAVDRRDADVDLSPLGRQQAAAVGKALADMDIDAVVSSPYVRARDTASIALPARQVQVDERLRDRELGVLDRLTSMGVAARFPEEAERRRWLGKYYYRPPGGESWADVQSRLRSWMNDLPANPGRIAVFTHDAPILLLRGLCEELAERDLLDMAARSSLGNASITRLVREHDRWSTAAFDERDHLGDLTTDHPAEQVHALPR